jgi:hypothetical protein
MIGFSARSHDLVDSPPSSSGCLGRPFENANSRKTMIVRWEFPLQVRKEHILLEID